MMSRTSEAYSGVREAMTWSNFVFCDVIPRVLNCASTWANQTSGSAGQNGGSFRLSAETRGSSEARDIVSRRGHQFSESQTELYDIHIRIKYLSTTCYRMF